MMCLQQQFLDKGYRYESEVCNSCLDVSMMAFGLENIAILNIKGVDGKCTINLLNNSKLDVKDPLQFFDYRIWTLVHIKQLLK